MIKVNCNNKSIKLHDNKKLFIKNPCYIQGFCAIIKKYGVNKLKLNFKPYKFLRRGKLC